MNELSEIKVTADPADSNSLPGWAYLDPLLYERERNEIFFRTWHYAGWVGDLKRPGDYITAELLDQNIVIVMGEDGAIQGFHNVCQHRGHLLLTGRGHVSSMSCPYHAWVYKLDGQLRNARGAERLAGFDMEQFRLRPVRVELFADCFVFFNLDMEARPLAELAGDMMADLVSETPELKQLVRSDLTPRSQDSLVSMFPCKANWKVVIDNFLECNHCRAAHPGFSEIVDMLSYRTYATGQWSTQRGLARKGGHKMRFWWLFPTTTISMSAEQGDLNFTIGSFTSPAGLSMSVAGRQDIYRLPEMSGIQPRADIFGALTGAEDRDLCESVQRGLASIGYSSGRIIHDPDGRETTEVGIHRFHKLVVDSLGL